VSVISRLASYAKGLVTRSGSYAPGSGFTPPPSWPIGWWQSAYRLPHASGSPAVEACVGVISQTLASLPIQHLRVNAKGGYDVLTDTVPARVLRRPNSFQTRADFFLNLVRAELLDGNGVAAATRDRKGDIDALYLAPPGSGRPFISPEDGSIFYSLARQDLLPEPPVESFWPQRDILHIRLHTPRHPLIGESPITAAALSVSAGGAINEHMSSFFANMTRPSGFLAVPKVLKPDVAQKLAEEWNKAYSAGNAGRVAVLMDGTEWKPMSINSVDAQLIESYRLTIADVARVYRVPLAVIGEMGGATFANTETLIRLWLSTGLGYIVEHIELALDHLFGLPPGDMIAFDLENLLRSDFAARVEGLTKGIQGGLFSPNEARGKEGLPRAEHGDEPRLQAQVVPLSAATLAPAAPAAPVNPAPVPTKPPESKEALKARFRAVLEDKQHAA
jgi:HK97 family phage portal protein